MAAPTREDFEAFLGEACRDLTLQLQDANGPKSSDAFQDAVGETLKRLSEGEPFALDGEEHPHVFPDFGLGEFGVEVKFTKNDTWRSVANSVFEGQRNPKVKHIYIVFGKAGGKPEVRFARYDDCIVHVRTSHVPRFEVDVTADKSLFESALGTTYAEFSESDDVEKMKLIRAYARGRLKPGERLWWLDEGTDEVSETAPIAARLYTSLSMEEKGRARAEAALLCPGIVASSRTRGKYDDAALFLATYRGILAHQARDLFSAGSVALRSDPTRGGNYLARALKEIETEMREAAAYLPDELFLEYWGEVPPESERIKKWLEKADAAAADWVPSEELFQS